MNRLLMTLVIGLSVFAAGLPLTRPGVVHAATCGGNIVVKADMYNGHHAIWVDAGYLSHTPAITRIDYWNGSYYELVPNADYGVLYSTPIGQDGRLFVYGVSTRWTWWPASHWSWRDSVRWRVWYNC